MFVIAANLFLLSTNHLPGPRKQKQKNLKNPTRIRAFMQSLNAHGGPEIWKITALFFVMYTLCATQDIAVDGWALTMLSPRNVDKGSICNSVGQYVGYYIAFMLFLALSDADTCNSYLRSVPSPEPIATLSLFMQVFSVVFLITTVAVFLFKKESMLPHDLNNDSVSQAYGRVFGLLRLPAVRAITIMLLTMRIGFGCVDSVSRLKLQEFGVSKETMASIGTIMFPVRLWGGGEERESL